jgi:hypothetical protein
MNLPSRNVAAPVRGAARIIGLLCLAIALQACSMVKLAYNNVGDLSYWWLDSYLDFDDTQTPQVRQDIARLMQWHRRNELPRLALWLQQAEQLAGGQPTPEQTCPLALALRERLAAVLAEAEPAAAALAVRLTPVQIKHIERKYAANNAEYRREWLSLSGSEQRDKLYQRLLDLGESFYGRLEEVQKEALRQGIAASSFDPQLSYKERLRRQQDLLATLRQLQSERASEAVARSHLHGYFERSLNSPDLVYRSQESRLLRETCSGLALLQASASAEQRDAVRKRLRAYQKDLEELIGARD